MSVRVTQEALVTQGPDSNANARVTQVDLITQGPVPTANVRVTQEALVTMGPNPIPARVTQFALVTMGPYPVSLAVTPKPSSLSGAGATLQFTAIATLSDGTTVNVTSLSAWTSSNPAAATINASSGLATAVASGTTTITATYEGLSDTSTLTVTVITVTSVVVTPNPVTKIVGQTQQFTAIAHWSDSTTTDVTNTAAWTSSSPATATINSTGLASAVAAGSTTITATYSGVPGTAALTVIAVTSVAVTPNPVNLTNTGQTQQFTATATWTDASTTDVTATAAWVSTVPGVATVNGTGLATSTGFGTTSVQATYSGHTGSATLNVVPTLTSITVTPSPVTIDVDFTQQFTATGHYTDGSTQNLTGTATWSSLDTSIATVNSTGLATGVSGGVVTIRATSGAIHGDASLTVAGLSSITISPLNPSILDGQTQQFTATGHYTNGDTEDITLLVVWTSGTTGVATIASSGLATSHAAGDTLITASHLSKTASTTLHVNDPQLVSVTVLPSTLSLPIGNNQQYDAVGTYTDGSTQDLTQIVNWSSSNTSKATIGLHGLAHAVAAGVTTITASTGSISGTATLTVTTATISRIFLVPENPTVPVGAFQIFQAIAQYSDGTTQDLTNSSVWSSSDVSVATITVNNGIAKAAQVGVTIIQALVNGTSVTTLMTVVDPALVSISISPPNPFVNYGDTIQFTATGHYIDGTTRNITSLVTWSSSDITVALIGSTGLSTAIHGGTSFIHASLNGIDGRTLMTVVAHLVSITVSPSSSLCSIAGNVPLTAIGSYDDGSTKNITASAAWSSTNPGMATVLAGLVTGVAPGLVIITATEDAVNGTALVKVIEIIPLQDPTQVQFRSHITQELQNYFDENMRRVRENPYSLDAQLLNMAAMQMEQSQMKTTREVESSILATSPANLDNRGVYFSSRIPPSFHIESGATDLYGVIGRRQGDVDRVVYPFNDLLPIPSRLEADPDVNPVVYSNPRLFTMQGTTDSSRQGFFQVQYAALGDLLFPGRMNFWLEGMGLNTPNLEVLIEGYTAPRPVWPGEQKLDSETLIISSEGMTTSLKRWQSVTQVTVRGLPTGATFIGCTVPFGLPTRDDARPFSHPAYRDSLFPRYWATTTDKLSLQEMFVRPYVGLEYVQSYRAQQSVRAVAVEPNTWGMFVADDQNIYYVDRREPLPKFLDKAAINVDPLYGLLVSYDQVNSTSQKKVVELQPVPYGGAADVFSHRFVVQDPAGTLMVLTESGLAPYSSGAGWRRGAPPSRSLQVSQFGTYLFTLECTSSTGKISADNFPYPNLALTPEPRADQLSVFPISTMVDKVKGLAFDDFGRLWAWTGSFAVALKARYDAYILDPESRTLFLTDPYDQVDVSNG